MRAWQFNYTRILQTVMSESETQVNRRQNRLKGKSRNQLTAVAGGGESTRLKIVSQPVRTEVQKFGLKHKASLADRKRSARNDNTQREKVSSR